MLKGERDHFSKLVKSAAISESASMRNTFSDDHPNATETIASIPVRLLQDLCMEEREA